MGFLGEGFEAPSGNFGGFCKEFPIDDKIENPGHCELGSIIENDVQQRTERLKFLNYTSLDEYLDDVHEEYRRIEIYPDIRGGKVLGFSVRFNPALYDKDRVISKFLKQSLSVITNNVVSLVTIRGEEDFPLSLSPIELGMIEILVNPTLNRYNTSVLIRALNSVITDISRCEKPDIFRDLRLQQ